MTDFIITDFGAYAAIRAVSERATLHLRERNAASTYVSVAMGEAGPTIIRGERASTRLADIYRARGFSVVMEG